MVLLTYLLCIFQGGSHFYNFEYLWFLSSSERERLLAKLPHIGFDDNKIYLCANLLDRSRKKFSWTLEKEEGDIGKEEINMEDQGNSIEDQVKAIED